MADPLTALGVISGLGKFLGNMLNYGQAREKQNYEKQMNERDFQYQQDLQQQIFAREDNAVQRRMADLEAAGLNPNLAAGSAAGAGTVVGRSNTQGISTPEMQVGSMLDTISAAQQIKAQKQQTENAKIEQQILQSQKEAANLEMLTSKFMFYKNMGFNPQVFAQRDFDERGRSTYSYKVEPIGQYDRIYSHDLGHDVWNITPQKDNMLSYMMDKEMQMYGDQASLLNKDLQWYTADKVINYGLKGLGVAGSFFQPSFTNYMKKK